MKTTNIIYTILIFLTLLACSGKSEVMNSKTTLSVESNKTLVLSEEQGKTMHLKTDKLKRMEISGTIPVNGEIELPPANKATVSALIGGRIRTINIHEGVTVKKGQVLATLENPEFITLQENYLVTKNNVERLNSEFERAKKLREKEINSEKEFIRIESEYNASKVQLISLKNQLELLGINTDKLSAENFSQTIIIKSPLDGYVQKISINLGQYVNVSDLLFEIVDNEHLHLNLHVFEKDIHQVSIGQNIHFYTNSNPNELFKASVFTIGKTFDTETKSITVMAEISEKAELLIPGMYVNGYIETSTKNTWVIPTEALIKEANQYFVFVQKDKNTFEKVQVESGTSDEQFSELILSNAIDSNSVIVTNGSYFLNAELNKAEE